MRQAVLAWLEQARALPAVPQAITDVALAAQRHFEDLVDAVARAAPQSEHSDLYGKVDGAWMPAYKVRSRYVHGAVLKDLGTDEKLKALAELRQTVRQAVLRWLVLTPCDTEDLAPLLDAAAQGPGRERNTPLREFFLATPPQDPVPDLGAIGAAP